MKKLLADHVLSWCSLILGCLALLIAGGLLLGGCGADRSEYQDVVDQVNAKYHEQLSVDLDHVDITPEQLRAHLEAVAQSRREAIPAADAASDCFLLPFLVNNLLILQNKGRTGRCALCFIPDSRPAAKG